MRAIRLQANHLTAPLGLGDPAPWFSWNCAEGTRQTAYQVIVRNETEILWDSGKVESAEMTLIPYEGHPLQSRECLWWSVKLWDETGKAGEEAESRFEMGLLHPADWKAQWVTGDYRPRHGRRYPVDLFRRTFGLHGKVKRARLYAAARGVYDVTINGRRVEDFILAPGMTDYRKRIQVQTYDVTKDLQQENEIVLRLADGWFRGSSAAYGVTEVYGKQTSVLAQLEVMMEDGKTYTLGTDETWRWCCDGPLRFADLKDGEIYDASMTPSFSGKAKMVAPPKEAKILPSDNVPVVEKERFSAKRISERVLDFGQNLAGYLELRVRGQKGQRVTFTLGEVLDAEGRVDLSGIQESRPAKGWTQPRLIKKLMTNQVSGEIDPTPRQEITLLLSGGEDHYKTSFAIFGFRYAQFDADVEILDARAIAVYSDLEQTGAFTCSDANVNRLVENTRWSMKSNFLDVPTDCPTRERLGWTGDAQIFFNTGAYLMNTAPFFAKWLQDMEDAQYKNGLLPAVVPFSGVEMMYKATGSSVGWADAVYLIPYRYYQRYGDVRILQRYWPMMRRYTDYLLGHLGMRDQREAKANPYNAYTYEKGVHLGEWLEPETFRDPVYGAKARHPEECTAYLYLTMVTMQTIASLVGEEAYAAKLAPYAEGAKQAYHHLIVEPGLLDTDRQAKLVRPLALGLLDGEDRRYAEDRLEKAVENYGYRVGTGFLSTPFILPVLTAAGKHETAYRMLQNPERPGWLSEVLDGATTVWESWEGDLSQNHYSPGAVCQWLFESVCGIQVDAPRRFRISPVPGGSLSFAEAAYESPYGTVKSGWKKEGEAMVFTITVPPNTTAEICLPGREAMEVTAGTYEWNI